MKKLFFIYCLLSLSSFGIYAQEMLLPLDYNPNLQQSSEKGYRRYYKDICGPKFNAFVSSETRAECFLTGGFSIDIINGQPPYTVSYNSLSTNGTLTTDVATFTIENVEAGAYFIHISDAAGRQLSIWHQFDNLDMDPSLPSHWSITQPFCTQPGKFKRAAFLPGAVSQYKLYRVENNGIHTLVQDYSTATTILTDILPGTYYVQRRNNSGCKSYYIFSITAQPTLQIPFIDDFSTAETYPNALYWQDNSVYINNYFATNPVSIGAATFDGLNEHGAPYTPSPLGEQIINGHADILTSQPVCAGLAAIPENDTLFLSFLYQPEGNGDWPNDIDSLIVEFLDPTDTSWVQVWGVKGPGEPVPNAEYYSVAIAVPDYLVWEGTQFRFRNNASISGNNDHWNIDYVRLSTEVPLSDAEGNFLLQDVAFVSEAPNMLKTYTAMPWKHFYGYMDQEMATSNQATLSVRNNFNTSTNRTIQHSIIEPCSEQVIYNYDAGIADVFGNISGTVTSQSVFITPDIIQAVQDFNPSFANNDSIVLENKWVLSAEIGVNDIDRDNDTLYHYQEFMNYFAYDDGSAEKAYALNSIDGKIAYRFHLNRPDTLHALQIMFVPQNVSLSAQEFKLAVWGHITPNSNSDELLYISSDWLSPQILPEINGFWTFDLEQPLPITADTIYVGFVQRSNSFLPVGFDVNNPVPNEIFYNAIGIWENTIQQGSLMIRPVFAGTAENINVGIVPPSPTPDYNKQLLLYPNPTNGLLTIKTQPDNPASAARVFDYSGRVVLEQIALQNNNALDIAALPQGMYMVQVWGRDNVFLGTEKVVLVK